MFGKKSEPQDKDRKIIVTTTDSIPGRKFEIIDVIVTDNKMNRFPKHINEIKNQLLEKALEVNADAVIGLRFFQAEETGTGGSTQAYGTAVRFTDHEGD